MVLVLEFDEDVWNNVFDNSPEWDKLTVGGTPGKKRPKKNSSNGIKKFKKR